MTVAISDHSVSYGSRPVTVAEYFAGIGLVRMGLEPYGWRVVFANDIAADKYSMYSTFFPDADRHYFVEDVFKLNPADVPPALLATCSFPCVDLSLAGNRGGINGKHSSAFWGVRDILQAQGDSRPPILLVENVPGWLSSNDGRDFRLTVAALNSLGYACDVFTLDALRFTAQSRLRVFLVGVRLQHPDSRAHLTLVRSAALLPQRLKECIQSNSDLAWCHVPLPEPPPLRTSGLSALVERIDDLDPRWWSDAEVRRHLGMMSAVHRERVSALTAKDGTRYRTFYRRCRQGVQRAEVRDDDLAGCLRTAAGGSGKQFLIEAGNGRIRMRTMTAREYARLQGVPETYHIDAEGVKALTGFGDAVCVPAIAWVAEHALTPLAHNCLQGSYVTSIPYG